MVPVLDGNHSLLNVIRYFKRKAIGWRQKSFHFSQVENGNGSEEEALCCMEEESLTCHPKGPVECCTDFSQKKILNIPTEGRDCILYVSPSKKLFNFSYKQVLRKRQNVSQQYTLHCSLGSWRNWEFLLHWVNLRSQLYCSTDVFKSHISPTDEKETNSDLTILFLQLA